MASDEKARYATLEPTQGGRPIFSGYDMGDSHDYQRVSLSLVKARRGNIPVVCKALGAPAGLTPACMYREVVPFRWARA